MAAGVIPTLSPAPTLTASFRALRSSGVSPRLDMTASLARAAGAVAGRRRAAPLATRCARSMRGSAGGAGHGGASQPPPPPPLLWPAEAPR